MINTLDHAHEAAVSEPKRPNDTDVEQLAAPVPRKVQGFAV